jgi:DNA-binding CsgD family transcriptional regulator
MISSGLQALPFSRNRLAAGVVSLGLFVLVFLVALWLEHPSPGLLHLHALPIALLALQLGIIVGLGAVAASLSMMAVWAELEGVELLLADYLVAVPFLLVVLLCQLAARVLGREPAAPEPKRFGPGRRGAKVAVDLTDRERDVLGLLALGHTNREAADALFLSVRTVESHRARIQQKLGLTSRAALVRYAMDHDLVADLPATAGGPELRPTT